MNFTIRRISIIIRLKGNKSWQKLSHMSIITGLSLKNKFARQKKKCIDITGTSSMLMKCSLKCKFRFFCKL